MSAHRREDRWQTCDRCGGSSKNKPSDWSTSWPLVSELRYAVGQHSGGTTIGPLDLCGPCTVAFRSFLQPRSPDAVPQPAAPRARETYEREGCADTSDTAAHLVTPPGWPAIGAVAYPGGWARCRFAHGIALVGSPVRAWADFADAIWDAVTTWPQDSDSDPAEALAAGEIDKIRKMFTLYQSPDRFDPLEFGKMLIDQVPAWAGRREP